MPLEIVRYDCGCIGTRPDSGVSKEAMILASCESGRPIPNRCMNNKTYASLSDQEGAYWAKHMFEMADKALSYDELSAMLRRVVWMER